MNKYFFKCNKIVYFDIDVADEFCVDVDIVRGLYTQNKKKFLKETVFEVDERDVGSIQIVHNRVFSVKPALAFTVTASLVIAVLCDSEQSSTYVKQFLQNVENKDQFDLVRSLNCLSVNTTKDTQETFRLIVKSHVIDILNELKFRSVDNQAY